MFGRTSSIAPKPAVPVDIELGLQEKNVADALQWGLHSIATGNFSKGPVSDRTVVGIRESLIADQAANLVMSALMIATNTNILMSVGKGFFEANKNDGVANGVCVITLAASIILFMLSILIAAVIGHVLNATQSDEQAKCLVEKVEQRAGAILHIPYKFYITGFLLTFVSLFSWLYSNYVHEHIYSSDHHPLAWCLLILALFTGVCLIWLGRSLARLVSDLHEVS
jgi:hypothetical protein